jgi:hypothetical protein
MRDELTNFFSDEFLEQDEALNLGLSAESPYVNYNVTGFDSNVCSSNGCGVGRGRIPRRRPSSTACPTSKGSVVSGKSALVKSGVLSSSPPAWQDDGATI